MSPNHFPSRPVLKRKDSGTVTTTPAAFNVLDNSIADVSFLVGMLAVNYCSE